MTENAKLELAKWCTVVSLLSVAMGHMFYTAWNSGAWKILHNALSTMGIDPVLGTKFLLLIAAGGFTTLLILMYNDYRKQYQSMLLGIAELIVLGVIYSFGFGGFIFELSALNLFAFLLGVAITVSLVAKSGDLSGFDYEQSVFGHAVDRNGTDLKFKNTTKFVKVIIFSVVMLGVLLNFYLIAETNLLQVVAYSGLSLGFMIAMQRFISIDVEEEQGSENSFELIGPKQSGKTFSTLGLYKAAADDEKYKFVDHEMDDLIEGHRQSAQLNAGEVDTGVGFDQIDGTELDENDEYWFEVTVNEGITKKAKVRTMDYQGELLPDIADAIETVATDGGVEKTDDEDGISVDPESGGESDSESPDTDESSEPTQDVDDLDGDSLEDLEPEYSTEFADVDYDSVKDEAVDLIEDISDNKESSDSKDLDSEITQEKQDTDDSDIDSEPADRNLSEPEEQSGFESEVTPSDNDERPEDIRKKIIDEVSNNVSDSDKLVMLLDVERYVGEYSDDTEVSMGVNSMRKIARSTDPDEIILVATKSDYLIDQWQDEVGSEYGPATNDKRWNSFRDFVSEEFYDNMAIQGFMDVVNTSRVYPVYFQTDENFDLKTDEDGNIQTEGYNDLLDALVR